MEDLQYISFKNPSVVKSTVSNHLFCVKKNSYYNFAAMSKLGLFLFVFALFVCCISAYAADPGVKLQADETVRVAREASAQPDPGHRWHNRGYQYHYQPQHYPSWNKYHGNGGWGGSRRKH